MLVLAVDTATPAVTSALHDGSRVVAQRQDAPARPRHGELLAGQLAWLLREAGATPSDVTHVAVGVGPGPYTGLRVGVATALAFAAVRDLPVLGLVTHDALAAEVLSRQALAHQAVSGSRPGPAGGVLADGFVVATDARRREVYWARYDAVARRVAGPGVARPDDLPTVARDLPTAGQGPVLHPGPFGPTLEPALPSAGALAGLAVRHLAGDPTVEVVPPVPRYLRRPDAVVLATGGPAAPGSGS